MRRDIPEPPRVEIQLSGEERTRRRRTFRRRAVFTDVCLVLTLASGALAIALRDTRLAWPMFCAVIPLLGATLAGMLLTYGCCPICGRRPQKWDWAWTPLLWRFFRCPVCGFAPGRAEKRDGGT